MKKYLFTLLLMVIGSLAVAQKNNLIIGIRGFQDIGFEIGFKKEYVGFKLLSACDYELRTYNEDLKNNKYSEHLGERYHLMYGAGFLLNVYDPLWLSFNVGYGWSGKYGWDKNREIPGSINTVKGLDVGLEVTLFMNTFYFSAGYETIPSGYKVNKPVNIFTLAGGFTF